MVVKILVLLLCLVVLLLVLGYFFPIVQICGYSMFPTLSDGEFYIGRRVLRKSKCKEGEIYVYRPPYESEEERFVIKRLSHINYTNQGKPIYYFLGDNSDDSYDSRYYGYVDSHNVVARIVLRKEV